jgi:hypothetical protein
MKTPNENQLKNFKQFPYQWAIIVLCGAIGVIFMLLQHDKERGQDNCFDLQRKYDSVQHDNVLYLRAAIAEKKEKETIKEIKEQKDSITHNKLVEPAKQVINNAN